MSSNKYPPPTATNPDTKKEGYNANKPRFFRNQKKYKQPHVLETKFKGLTTELEGHIFDLGVGNQAELFTNASKQIASYSGRTCKEPQDIRLAL